ncbi:hypothetical protein GTY65_00360 [Streptomyces sp. SID8379]|uniref:hypothetical protein n=1 Tax=unclassified Streptomyces TaxID=2593676 RepID=UPI00036FB26C|nr:MULTISPECIES: hypothetical protein [unclassified Streptomyces]MYW62540.1 hypothetical protein [Streptomyces sp. SID8379]
MFDSFRSNHRRRRFTQAWFWEDFLDAVSDFVRSRSVWVVVGNAGSWVSAVTGVVYCWSRPPSLAQYAVIQLACLVFQSVALLPVARPGRSATPRDVDGYADLHEGLTLLNVCGSWIFGVFPVLGLFIALDVDTDSPHWSALFFSGTALMLACVAGLITGVFLSDKARTRRREAAGPPGESDWADSESSGDAVDVDSGGFDSD